MMADSKMREYADRWLQMGLSTTPCDRDACSASIRRFVTTVLQYDEPVVVWMDGPIHAWYATCMLAAIDGTDMVWDQVGYQVRAQVRDQVRDQVWDQVRAQVWAQVRDQVRAQVRDQVGAQVRAQVRDQVRAQVRAQVRDQVSDQVWAQVGDQVWDQVMAQVMAQVGECCWPYTMGGFDSGYYAFYEFMREQFGLAYPCADQWDSYVALSRSGPVWILRKFAIACDHPSEMHMQDRVLHREGGPSVAYRDGTCVWSLHGIRVEQWMAEDDPGQWTQEKVLGVENVDHRREVIRRYGIDRLWSRARILDSADGYMLGELDVTGFARRYLRMQNPSIGVFHVEAVAPQCETVQQALNFRNQLPEKDVASNGSPWYQHGDVLLYPAGGKRFRPQPEILR